MRQKIKTFLMFEGRAEEAIRFYVDLFEAGHIVDIDRYGPEGPGKEGTVKKAVFALHGQDYIAIDSPAEHDFGFTPAISLFVECESEAELDRLFEALSEKVLMPPDDYGFSRKFSWVEDRFGVSWQLNLP